MKKKFLEKFSFLFFTLLFFTCVSAYGQDMIKVNGIVTDTSTGETLLGVSVVEKGTTNGTITDLDGKYSLQVSNGASLIFTYVGYDPKEVKAKAGELNVTMGFSQQMLEEIVVVGYGVQKKSVVTAAISRVTSEDLNSSKPSRVEDALKGKVSGVQITQSSGQPGAASKVRIRGIGTVNNSDPLYIVDGMPVDGGINYLNPVDIESVEILKDAASAAIYGARAANGVVLVTTKGGKEGKAIVNYNFSYGWQNPWKKKSVLNATEYMVIMNESQINDGNAPRYSQDQIAGAGRGTDWQKETFNYDAPVQNHQLSISGGSEKMKYFLSLGYYNQEGIIGGNYDKSNYDRWSVRSNSTYDVYEAKDRDFLNKVTVGVNLGYSRGKTTGVEVNSEFGSILGSALAFNPTTPVYASADEAKDILAAYPYAVTDKNGNVFSLPPAGFQELANPVAMLNQPRGEKNNEDKFVGTFWAELDVYKGLKFKSSYGVDLAFWGKDGYEFPYHLANQGKSNTQSSVWSEMNRGSRWQVENVLSYSKTFNAIHNFSAVLGQSANKYRTRNLKGWDYNLLETDPSKGNINSAIGDRDDERVEGGTNDFNFEALASYFARLDYNFDERYMAQFTLRRDGSSHFGPKNKWAMFPAVSLGWNVLNESFVQDLRPEWFDVLKLRFSWGKNGNEKIGNFRYTGLMEGNRNYYFGFDKDKKQIMYYGAAPGTIANPDIKWEESEQIDLGLDARFLNGALNFGFDYFKKKTNGMLMDIPIPKYVGQAAPLGNVGDMENWGLEFEVGYRNKIGDVTFNVSANATYMKNKLIHLGNANGEAVYENAGASGVGEFIKGKNGNVWPYFYGYKTDGIFQNQAEVDAHKNSEGKLLQPKAKPGDVRFVDYDGNGVINDEDKTNIGKGMPDWTYGITLGAEWKGFDVNLFFQGTAGNDVFDFSQRSDIPAMNRPSWVLNRWIGEGTSNKIPRMTTINENGNWKSSDLYVKNGSYLRLKTAQLGYTLPRSIVSKASIQSLRFYVSAENLLTFTGYDGYDPEVAAGDDYNRIGVDKGVYPQSRTISIGANVTF